MCRGRSIFRAALLAAVLLTQPWDISTPVTANMTLYAGWEAETSAAGTSPWWALLALPGLAVMALRVKKSRN